MTIQEHIIKQYANQNVWSVFYSDGMGYNVFSNATWEEAKEMRNNLQHRRWREVHIVLQIEDLD